MQAALPDVTDITDSPELGPPPVAHFDDRDPVKQDRSLLDKGQEASAESDMPSELAFANLETRRKRKENNAPKDSLQTEHHVDQKHHQASSSSSQILKQGAKRKLSTRDEGDSGDVIESDTPFSFVRRNENQSIPPGENSKHSRSENKPISVSRNKSTDGAKNRSASRKALGESEDNALFLRFS